MSTPDTLEAILQRSPVLGRLPAAVLSELSAAMRPVDLPAGGMLFLQGQPGDSLFVVERGTLRVFRVSPDGRERTLAYLRAGDVLGEMAALGGLPRSASVQATEPSRLWRIDREALLKRLKANPDWLMSIVELLARRLAEADLLLEEAAEPVTHRLVPVLRRLAARAPAPARAGAAVCLQVTQQELAALTGATRESVNRGLARLEARGIVVRRARGCIWVDAAKLQASTGEGT